MMCFVVMSQVLFIFEHFVAIFTLECVIILEILRIENECYENILNLMSLFMSFSVGNGVKNNSTVGAPVCHPFMWSKMSKFVLI